MKKIRINPNSFCGEVKVPPSKSLQHRAIMAASICNGVCYIHNVELSKDIEATCRVLKNLGVKIELIDKSIKVSGRGNFKVLNKVLDCGESGSTLRFIIPSACTTGEEIVFKGKGKLNKRPLEPYYDIFKNQNILYKNNNGDLPLKVKGRIKPGTFNVRGDISSQFITGLLFMLPILNKDSLIKIKGNLESKPYIDLTIDILEKFSIEVQNRDYKEFYIRGNQKYLSCDYNIEGDFSQAAFWIGAGVLNGDITIRDLNLNSIQGDKKVVDIVKKMGGNISVKEDKIIVKKSELIGIEIDASEIPDLVPILAVIGALSKGRTKIKNASRLRIKESDRLKAISEGINNLGGEVYEGKDYIIIEGKEMLEGGEVDSFNDHRIAMALAIASTRCKNSVIINNSEAVNKSYPHFYEHFKKLGGDILCMK